MSQDIEDLNEIETTGNIHRLDIAQYVKAIDPTKYFHTSGDAICKTEKLIEDLQELVRNAKRLYAELVTIRGDNKYLETEFDNGSVIIRIKNPRSSELVPRKHKYPDSPEIINKGDLLFKKNETSYCVINPDDSTFCYFNFYKETGKIVKQKSGFTAILPNLDVFLIELEKKGYNKVLI